VLKLKKPEDHPTLYKGMLASISELESVVEKDYQPLFEQLLSYHAVVFEFLQHAKDNGEVCVTVAEETHDEAKEKEVRKSYNDVLKEVDDFFTALIAMILPMSPEENRDKSVGDIMEVLACNSDFPELRMRLMMTVYNMFPPSYPFRFAICRQILDYCVSVHKFETLAPYMQNIESWMADWQMDAEARRALFAILATEFKLLNRPQEAYKFQTRHMKEYQGASKELLNRSSVVSAAVDLANESIKRPDIIYFDSIRKLDAINNLSDTSESHIVKLLDVFVSGGPSDLESFFSKQEAFCELHGFNYAQCLRKIRLLELATHAANSPNGQLSLTPLAAKLSMSESDVEELVVLAIGENLLDAKIDQINKVVLVKAAMQREFERPQWERFQARLASWKENTQNLLDILRNT